MNLEQANEILKLLADGYDPLTGEQLPADHVVNKREVLAALNMASAYFEITSNPKLTKKLAKDNQPPNHGAPWSEKDEEFVKMQFAEGKTATDIGKLLGRSRGSIWSKLKGLGLVEEE